MRARSLMGTCSQRAGVLAQRRRPASSPPWPRSPSSARSVPAAADGSSDASYDQGIAYDDSVAPEEWRDVPMDEQEEYDDSPEQPFQDVTTSPLSTFASDVDTASYSNLRRQLRQGVAPEGVRIEELVNYFDYDYPTPEPSAEDPFTVTTQIADAPWAPEPPAGDDRRAGHGREAHQPWQQHRLPARRVRLDGRAEQAAAARRLVRAAGRAARRGRHRLDRDLRRQRPGARRLRAGRPARRAGAGSCASCGPAGRPAVRRACRPRTSWRRRTSSRVGTTGSSWRPTATSTSARPPPSSSPS